MLFNLTAIILIIPSADFSNSSIAKVCRALRFGQPKLYFWGDYRDNGQSHWQAGLAAVAIFYRRCQAGMIVIGISPNAAEDIVNMETALRNGI